MSSVTIESFLSEPLSVVHEKFQAFIVSSGMDALKKENNDWGMPELLTSLFHLNDTNSTLIHRIPSLNNLNTTQIKDNSLTRFRCMVQNTLNPEYYLGVYCERNSTGTVAVRTGRFCEEVKISNGYKLVHNSSPGAPRLTDQRMVLNCISIPGETFWVKEGLSSIPSVHGNSLNNNNSTNFHHQRRQNQSSAGKKRKREDAMNDEDGQNDTEMISEKKVCDDVSSAAAIASGEQNDHNINVTVKPCGSMANIFKVGDIVEFVGIVSDATNKHKVLHPITYRKLNQQTGYPPLRSINFTACGQMPSEIVNARSSLLQYITCVCGGDALLAELLLLYMVSRVHFRQQKKPIGKLCLNILVPSSTFPSPNIPLPQLIYQLCSTLLPRVETLHITCDNLNNQRFRPKKDFDTEQLLPAKLQTASETFIICDETDLTAGNLNKTGVENLNALKKLANLQILDYDFTYNTIEFKQDNPILVFSQKKSLSIQPDICIPIQSKTNYSLPSVSTEQLNIWREFLQLSRKANFTLSDSATNMVSESFVKMRQAEGRTKITEKSFHLLMTLARLLMASRLVEGLKPKGWSDTQTLFKAIRDRCNKN